MTTLVFGSLGTEVHVDGHRFEIVELNEGEVTWRGKCVVCRTPIFLWKAGGYLPRPQRCDAHKGKKNLPIEEPGDVDDQGKTIIQRQYGNGVMPVEQMLPVVREEVVRNSLVDSLDHNAMPAAVKAAGDPFGREALLGELADFDQEEEEFVPPAPPADEIWLPRLKLFVTKRMWLPGWGEKPGHPNCDAPPELISQFLR